MTILDIPRMVAFLRTLGITADTPREELACGVVIPWGDKREVYIPRCDWPAVAAALDRSPGMPHAGGD